MRRRGADGEDRAAEYLQSLGFAILARNYAVRGGEIDLIAREGDTIAFVEVKARKSLKTTAPREHVTPAKRNRIIMAAQMWLQREGLGDSPVRFDIVEITPLGPVLLRAAYDAGS